MCYSVKIHYVPNTIFKAYLRSKITITLLNEVFVFHSATLNILRIVIIKHKNTRTFLFLWNRNVLDEYINMTGLMIVADNLFLYSETFDKNGLHMFGVFRNYWKKVITWKKIDQVNDDSR